MARGMRRTRTREQADVWGARQDEVEESLSKDRGEVEGVEEKKKMRAEAKVANGSVLLIL